MKHSEVLSRYVNTGESIPEKQFNRLTPVLKKSYLRTRGIAGYFEWEFKIISDNQKINYIETKGVKLTYDNDIKYLLIYSVNKDDIATKIIQAKGEKLYYKDIELLLEYSENKDDIETKIIQAIGEKLSNYDIIFLFLKSDNNDNTARKIIEIIGEKLETIHILKLMTILNYRGDIATKIIKTKGNKLNYSDVTILLIHAKMDKELIKKLFLQNGVDYNLINKSIKDHGIDTPLIPDNYQSMLQEIKRIKQIML
jgi:oligoribonuclease NrnB/cAMP/cGMP phosphodiesterase (DHH superfamily)